MDHLDPGLVKRPSRFDRKYSFPLPSFEERLLYCDFWRTKLRDNKSILFPKKLGHAIADITGDFTFAYLKEAFVMTLIALAHTADADSYHDNYDGIEDLVLWKEMQKQVKMLREDMESKDKEDEEEEDFMGPPPPMPLHRAPRRVRRPPIMPRMPPPPLAFGPRPGFSQNGQHVYGRVDNVPFVPKFGEEAEY